MVHFRLGQLLNLSYEKTPENLLQSSILSAADSLGVTVVDFTATEDVYYHGIKGRFKCECLDLTHVR